ncbi:G8 domain-containing protein DDB_G0286311-like [Poeciliopsis prolifica]|uniref:G8 domain-containing protein DDB_G0286311-like n=1 Tax=Poeciliopsis prolifica TaxID=188132 RepID=UPI0024138EE3|nr:G8 domain-containing protein DDB_G0286311-like [Poeciliopsis prolifica]
MNATEAEIGLEFNKTTPLVELPRNEDVQKTLAAAIDSHSNNTILNVPFSPGSVQVLRTPLPTTLPTTNSTETTIAPNSTTTPSSTVKPTTKIPPTVEATVTRKLTFRSLGETFTTDLLNPSSAAFKNRAALIKSNLEPLFQREFSTLRDFIVTSFSNGSIINNMDLKFSAAFLPTNIQIAEVLLKAASNVTAFNIDTASILVDDTPVSSGVSHNISLITALSMVLLSWLLSNQQ